MQTKFRSGTIAGIRMGQGPWWKGPSDKGGVRHVFGSFSLADHLEAGTGRKGKKMRERPVAVRDLVSHCLALAQAAARAGNIKLEACIEPGLPSVMANRNALEKVLINILSNAIKFTGDDGAVAVQAGRSANGDLFLAISDTGIGMSRDEVEKSLAPFAAHTREMRQGDRVGLGLPQAAALMRAHGGDILIESLSGLGSIVTATLPAARLVGKTAA